MTTLFREFSPRLETRLPALRPDLAAKTQVSLPRRPRCVLFDVYGTLVVSAAGGEPNAVERTSPEGRGAKLRLDEELAAADAALGAEAFSRKLTERIRQAHADSSASHPEVDVERLLAEMFPGIDAERLRRWAVLHEAWANPCDAMPGALEAVRRLAGSTRLGLVSNAQFYTPLLLEALWGAPPEALGFEPALSVYSYRLGIAKPAREPFQAALAPLAEAGIPPSEVLVVGNSAANDIAPARGLGCMTALFAGDSRSFRPGAPGDSSGEPDLVLTGWPELSAALPLSRETF